VTRPVTSASNIFRRALCPGSERLETGLPEEDSAEAKEGTMLHAFDAAGKNHPHLDWSTLKPHQRDLLEISDKLRNEVLNRVIEQFGLLDGGEDDFGHERELFLHRGIKSLFPGHCDDWWYWGGEKKTLVILDKKFGYKEVTEAAANLQLRAYAVMGAELHDVENCVVAITQPRLPFDRRLTMAVYNREEIAAAREQLYQIWDACKAPDAPLHATEEGCRYCRARAICPELSKTIQENFAIVPAVTGLTKTAREAVIEERIKQASDVDLQKMFEAVHLAGFVKEPLFEEMRARIRDGQMPGYELGKESEVREVTDTARAVAAILYLGIPQDRAMAACKLAVGKVEEAYRDTHDGCTWKDAKDAVNTALDDVIERKPKKPSIEKVKALHA
jgi:hypothetical protein